MELIALAVFLVALALQVILFLGGIIGLIVSRFIKSEKLRNISKCLVMWTTVFFLFPKVARKAGYITNRVLAWVIAFLPILVMLCAIVVCINVIFGNTQVPYEDLPYTSREEITAIIEMPDFPEFEYKENSKDNWSGDISIWFSFKDENQVAELFETLNRKVNKKDNVFWEKASDSLFVFSRGWDGVYASPAGIENSGQLVIDIRRDGFCVIPQTSWGGDLDSYANSDSMYVLTGVRFPKYKIVNVKYEDYWQDFSYYITIKLNRMPSQDFINALKKSNQWSESNGKYIFCIRNRHCKSKMDYIVHEEEITVDPQSRLVEIEYRDY